MTQPNSPVPTDNTPRKWACCPNKPPGKIQLNRVNSAFSDLRQEHYTSTERSGIFGKTEGYDAERSYSTVRFQVCGENPERADVRAVQDQIGELASQVGVFGGSHSSTPRWRKPSPHAAF